MTAVITFPPIGSTKFILTRYDAMLYINFVNEICHIYDKISEDQKNVTNDLADWVDNTSYKIKEHTMAKVFLMIDFVNMRYDSLIEALKQYRHKNIEIIEEEVEQGIVNELTYTRYCKHLKELWERIDNGLYKVWFQRRAEVLKNYKPSVHMMMTMIGEDSIDVKVVKKTQKGRK